MAYPTHPSSATDLLSRLSAQFEAARSSGQLFFFPSQAKDVQCGPYRFNLRTCPALLDKAKAKAEALAAVQQGQGQAKDDSPQAKRARTNDPTSSTGSGPPGDPGADKQNTAEPFKPPYVEELYLGCLDGLEGQQGMSILLNKYAVLPEHMLLCPPTYQPQSLPPTPHQLALAYSLLLAASRHPARPRRLLGFYNGGEGAGASQAWRHLQFVEVPGGRAPVEEWVSELRFERLDEARIHPRLPYLHIVHPLPPPSSLPLPLTPSAAADLVDFLAPALMRCLDIAFDALRAGGAGRDGGWNLLLTLEHMHLVPRTAAAFALPSAVAGPGAGTGDKVELNALGYAGMMLVRSEEEEEALLAAVQGEGGADSQGEGLMRVLSKCGVPRAWGEEALKAGEAQHGMAELA